jgi:hypothetical protein
MRGLFILACSASIIIESIGSIEFGTIGIRVMAYFTDNTLY